MTMIECVLRPELNELIERKDFDGLRAVFAELSPPDVAEVIDVLLDAPGQEEGVIFRVLPRAQAAAVFSYLPLERQAQLVHQLSQESVRSILNAMTPDDRTRMLEELPDNVTRRLLESLSPDELQSARQLLGYPERTAGRYMTPRYAALRPEWTAREALEQIRRSGRDKETLHVVYVVAHDGTFVHDIKLGALVLAEPETKVVDIPGDAISIPAAAPGEEVVSAFEKYDRVALPVVDSAGHMLGIITVDDVLEFAEKQATREIQKLGGSEALDAPYREVGPLADAQEARRMAGGAVHRRDAHRHRDGPFRKRDPARRGRRAVRPAHHQLRRQLRLAGDVDHHPLAGAAGASPARLVVRRSARRSSRG
jgi:magnesium transporter